MVARVIKGFIKAVLLTVVTGVICIALLMAMAIQGHAEDLNGYEAIFASASEADYEALENIIYHESAVADCDFTVNVAVAETVLNRVLSGEWPDSIEAVCKQKGQFAYGSVPKNMNEHTAEDISDAIEHLVNGGKGFLPSKDYVFFSTNWKYQKRYATDFVWVGETNTDGTPKKHRGHWYGKAK